MALFDNCVDFEKLKCKKYSEYTAGELAAYATKYYPGDPISFVKLLEQNVEIGYVLSTCTLEILKGANYDKIKTERN